MILASIVLGTEQPGLLQKILIKHGEVADIVVGPQVVRGIIRFKMQDNQIVKIRGGKGCLICIDIIRILLTDCLHTLKEQARVHHIIMVKKSNEITRCHGKAYIGISGNSQILLNLFIDDSLVLFLIIQTNLTHILVFIITAVCQTKFPVFIGLCLHGLDHLPQEFFRGIVKRYQHADLDLSWKYRLFFSPAFFCIRKALCSKIHPFGCLTFFLFPAFVHSLDAAIMDVSIAGTDHKMNHHADWLG